MAMGFNSFEMIAYYDYIKFEELSELFYWTRRVGLLVRLNLSSR